MPRAQPKTGRHPPPRCQARLIPGPSLANFLKDGGVTGGWSDTVEPIRLEPAALARPSWKPDR